MRFSYLAAAAASLLQLVHAQSLVDVLTQNNENTLIALVKSEPEILKALASFKGTLFAPTDDALAATVSGGFNASDLKALAEVLTYHVVPSVVFPTTDFSSKAFLKTLQGNEVVAVKTDNGIMINAANVVKTVTFDGGNIHIIDATLIPPANVVDVAKGAGLTSLLGALTKAGLADTVAGLKNVTILAPTNDAFAAIQSVSENLSADQLKQVLLLHIVPSIVHSTDIVAAKSIPTAPTKDGSQTLAISFDGTNVLVSGAGNKSPAKVVTADVLADGVIVHVIDAVLIPTFASNSAPQSSVAASVAASTATAAASQSPLYKGSGSSLLVGAASSVALSTDPSLVRMRFSVLCLTAAVAQLSQAQSLVDALTQSNEITLITLVKTLNLTSALANFTGTLFAPTDNAFEALNAGGFNASDLKAVANVLTYHVVPTIKFPTADFTAKAFLTTEQGNEVEAVNGDNGITINGANVVNTVTFDGGNVHIIDAVLIPPANVVEVATKAGLKSLIAAVTKAGLAEAVSGLKDVTILAPTDEAFAAIQSVAENLSLDQLKQVLLYHVIPRIVHSTDIVAAMNISMVPTEDGSQTLSAAFDGTNVLITGSMANNTAKVTIADVLADHVIVHVIDTVLIPSFTMGAPALPVAAGTASATGTKMAPAATGTVAATAQPSQSGALTMVAGMVAAMASALLLL
ncbi:FAS1 domain-containing protein [Chytriomyces sp. MP71]|nr:FAS1 domain-containing protein [Chytriomyces sp. MP71]